MYLYVYTRVCVCVCMQMSPAASAFYTYITNQSDIIVNKPKWKEKKMQIIIWNFVGEWVLSHVLSGMLGILRMFFIISQILFACRCHFDNLAINRLTINQNAKQKFQNPNKKNKHFSVGMYIVITAEKLNLTPNKPLNCIFYWSNISITITLQSISSMCHTHCVLSKPLA